MLKYGEKIKLNTDLYEGVWGWNPVAREGDTGTIETLNIDDGVADINFDKKVFKHGGEIEPRLEKNIPINALEKL